jgi:hypothetical protein
VSQFPHFKKIACGGLVAFLLVVSLPAPLVVAGASAIFTPAVLSQGLEYLRECNVFIEHFLARSNESSRNIADCSA